MAAKSAPKTAREFSAGGIVVRRRGGQWWMVAIQPAGRRPPKGKRAKPGLDGGGEAVLALPKGIIDPGERAEQTAVREVREETGVQAELIGKLGDVKYVYVRSWGDRARVFKVVSYFLLRYRSGRLGDLPPETRHEVAHTLWIALDEGPQRLTYKGDREMAKKALEALTSSTLGTGK